jgi:hypothetical protein
LAQLRQLIAWRPSSKAKRERGNGSTTLSDEAAAHDALTAAERIAESMGYGREYVQRLVIDEGA